MVLMSALVVLPYMASETCCSGSTGGCISMGGSSSSIGFVDPFCTQLVNNLGDNGVGRLKPKFIDQHLCFAQLCVDVTRSGYVWSAGERLSYLLTLSRKFG